MIKTKLIDILKTFSVRERSKFRDYIHSPFFNKNQKIRELCDYTLKYAPEFNATALKKQAVFPFIFQEQDYNELKLNNIISDLLQLCYDFLAQKTFNTRKPLQKNFLLEELLKRDAYEHIERSSRRFRQIQDSAVHRNHQYFFHNYLFYENLDRYFLAQPKRRYDENLQLQNDNLDLYYFSNKLRIACDMASRNIVINAGYVCHFLKNLIDQYEQDYENYQSIPALSTYYQVLLMLKNEEEEAYYQDLKTALQMHAALFPKAELWILYKYALNHCIKKINSGQSAFYGETLDLYKVLLENETLFHNGYITQWTFKNIITAGIRMEAFEWTENFIETYQNQLLPEEHFNATTYNRAALFSAKKEYKNALQELHNVEFTDSSYHLGAKTIQLKSFYELNETEPLFALIEAFKKYLLRNRDLADYRKKANNNLLKLCKSIYQLKTEGHTLSTSAFNRKHKIIREKLSTLDPIANKDWLEEIFGKV